MCLSERPSPDQAALPDNLSDHVPAAADSGSHPGLSHIYHVGISAQGKHCLSSWSVTATYPTTCNKSNSPLWSQVGDQSVLITIFPLNICNFLGHCWAIEILLFTKGLITLKICLLLLYRLKSFQGTVIDLNLLYWHRVCGIQHIQRASTEKSLTLFESFYFTIVTFSTVGYGDISPDIWLGQLFMVLMICIAFAFIPRQVCVVYTWHMDLKFYTNMEKYSYNCLEICVGTFIWFHPM